MRKSENVVYEKSEIGLSQRELQNGHQAFCLWFTGLSGSGKSTIAGNVEKKLFIKGFHVFRLDGDNVRHGLCGDLGFTVEDRVENIRRVGHAAKLLYEAGNIVLCSFISPYRQGRDKVRSLFPKDHFFEIYVKCDLDICKERDPKGLYKKALSGEIQNFTGISSEYEVPIKPEVELNTEKQTIEEATCKTLSLIQRRGIQL